MCYECTKELLVFIKHVDVELIISLGKLVKGASPQGIGHQVEPDSDAVKVSFPAPFQAYGAGDEGLDNDHSSTTERLGQRSLERRLIFKESEFETKFEQGRYFLYPDLCIIVFL